MIQEESENPYTPHKSSWLAYEHLSNCNGCELKYHTGKQYNRVREMLEIEQPKQYKPKKQYMACNGNCDTKYHHPKQHLKVKREVMKAKKESN